MPSKIPPNGYQLMILKNYEIKKRNICNAYCDLIKSIVLPGKFIVNLKKVRDL